MMFVRSLVAYAMYPLLLVIFVTQQQNTFAEGDILNEFDLDSDTNDGVYTDPLEMMDSSNTNEQKFPDVYESQKLLEQLQGCLADNRVLTKKLFNQESVGEQSSAACSKKKTDSYFKQYVRHFLEAMYCFEEQCDAPLDVDVNIQLTLDDIKTLHNMVLNNGNTLDALEVMMNMIQSKRHKEYSSLWDRIFIHFGLDETMFYVIILAFLGLCSCIVFEMRTSMTWSNQLLVIFVVLFIVSLPWNWLHLYQEKLAERHAHMMKQSDIPEQCLPGTQLTPLKAFQLWFRKTWTIQKDDCKEYHTMYMVNPLLEVSPIMAFSKTAASLLFSPASELGKAMAEFHVQFLGNLPVFIWIPALVIWLLILVAFILVMFRCGCNRQQHMIIQPVLPPTPTTPLAIEQAVREILNRQAISLGIRYREEYSPDRRSPVTLRQRGNQSIEEMEVHDAQRLRPFQIADAIDGSNECEGSKQMEDYQALQSTEQKDINNHEMEKVLKLVKDIMDADKKTSDVNSGCSGNVVQQQKSPVMQESSPYKHIGNDGSTRVMDKTAASHLIHSTMTEDSPVPDVKDTTSDEDDFVVLSSTSSQLS